MDHWLVSGPAFVVFAMCRWLVFRVHEKLRGDGAISPTGPRDALGTPPRWFRKHGGARSRGRKTVLPRPRRPPRKTGGKKNRSGQPTWDTVKFDREKESWSPDTQPYPCKAAWDGFRPGFSLGGAVWDGSAAGSSGVLGPNPTRVVVPQGRAVKKEPGGGPAVRAAGFYISSVAGAPPVPRWIVSPGWLCKKQKKKRWVSSRLPGGRFRGPLIVRASLACFRNNTAGAPRAGRGPSTVVPKFLHKLNSGGTA